MKLRFPPAWVMVTIGLILNVMAIVLTSQVLDKMSSGIAMLQERKEANVYSMQLAWNQVETLERKREALLLHLDGAAIKPEVVDMLTGQLYQWVGTELPPIDIKYLPELMGVIDAAQDAQRELIDELYLDNLGLSETLARVEEDMAYYKNIAVFLQIFGLALILARDLSRRSLPD
ncbi:DNA mismatch repair protein [Vibrio parahaemolyticus]|uniref:DNA mismatch repair protein n=1 Tax=Vibrio mediterranei TaxID=689 RepID=UPI0040694058